ncbi:MAG: alpha/beta hydrolase [Candidatus Hermodarchaeia archaeon]
MKIEVQPTSFNSEGETLRGHFVLPRGNGPFPGICKFHGLPGSSDQISGIATRLAEAGFAVLTFDFRGFRSSEGLFRLANQVKDAKLAVTHLLESHYTKGDWVGVYGPSYGGAVAILAAARDLRISAVGLRAPVYDTLWFARSPMIPTAVEELVQNTPDQMHGLIDPQSRKDILRWMVEDAEQLNPMNEINRVAPRPLFIITGDADLGIDVSGVKRLFDAAMEPKEMVVVKDADHNLSSPAAYETTVNAVIAWFQRQLIQNSK